MGSRHRKHDKGGIRTAMAGLGIAAAIGVPSVVAVAVAPSDQQAEAAQTIAHQPVRQDGRVVDVTPTSVTAVGQDGRAVTYQVTPETTSVTTDGGAIGAGGFPFAVNDEVSIVGEVRGDTAVATAVADRGVSDGNGPPMDYALP